jgi:membrane protein
VAFFLQNYEIYRNNNRFSDLSFAIKKVIALQTTHLIIKHFVQQDKPLTAAEIAIRLLIPIAVIQPVLVTLLASHIIVEYKKQDELDEVYQPAVDINILTVAYVIKALENQGQNHLPDIKQEQIFISKINEFRLLMEASAQNCLLKDM